MKLTLKQKREIVRRFMDGGQQKGHTGESIWTISMSDWRGPTTFDIEQIIRDFLNGKFKLEKK